MEISIFNKLLPYRLTYRGGIINTIIRAPLRRRTLLANVKNELLEQPNTVTVVIGIKNRSDYRLRNALWSLAKQKYDKALLDIIVIDYGSETEHQSNSQKLCDEFGAECVLLANAKEFNKSNCLNYAIKRTDSKFLLSSDVDVIFPQNYIEIMVDKLLQNPLSVVYSRMNDLPESSTPLLKKLYDNNLPIAFDELLSHCSPRGTGIHNAGINGTYTIFYKYIRGYDEFFCGWGVEDNDLMVRFERLGLDICSIFPITYLHQWHPKGEGIIDYKATAKRNRVYYEKAKSIIRNPDSWGEN